MSKIDVHHHVYPPAYTKGESTPESHSSITGLISLQTAIADAGGDPSGWYVPEWTVAADKALSKAVGNKTAVLSITAPGPSIVKESAKAAALAHELNDYMAQLRNDDPEGYGFFGTVPSLLDTEACLKEIDYMFDELHADGVTLFTRYGKDNHYLGHPDFAPIWAALSAREAVVFVHPTHPVDTNLINKALPQPMFDYPHETGRTAMDLIVNHTLQTNPGCKVILSHAGGTLPYLVYRVAGMLPHTPVSIGMSTDEIVHEAQRFYFDTAISSNPITLSALTKFAKPGHVMFGTDFPNAPVPGIEYNTKNLADFPMDEEMRRAVYYEGALGLFPRLRKHFT